MIELKFGNLTTAQAQELLEAHLSIISGRRLIHMRPDDPLPQTDKPQYPLHMMPGVGAPTTNPLPQPPTIPNAPMFTPPPPPVADPSPANGAAPTLPPSNVIALPVGQTDARGVVWHPTWHSGDVGKPGLNKNGSWKKRKNSDDAGHAAYEALFLTAKKDAVAEVFAEFTTVPTFTPPPPAVAPVAEVIVPPPGTPGVADFEGLWAKLVADQKVNADIENWFIATFGGHPVHSFVYRNDPVKRLNAYNQMKFYAT